jgi:hypothetical protein
MYRLYSPAEGLFDGSWSLPDARAHLRLTSDPGQ